MHMHNRTLTATFPQQQAPRRGRAFRTTAHILRLTLFLLTALGLATFLGGPAVGIWQYTHRVPLAIAGSPADVHLPYQSVTFPSQRDHTTLCGWFISAPGSRRAIIFAHGIGANRWAMPMYAPLASLLHRAGYNLLTFDFRAEGASGGATITLGAREQYDLLGAVGYVRARLGSQARIGILGYSMGAATAVLAAADDPTDIRAVVADSAFADFPRLIDSHLGTLPQPIEGIVAWTIVHEAPLLIGVDPDAIMPITAARTLTNTPVFYIAGTKDAMIPYHDSVELYQQTPDRHSQLWLVPGAAHVSAYFAQPQAYQAHLLAFLQRYL
jgi:pimeloyl-ACP methyl ester carboxylesterase